MHHFRELKIWQKSRELVKEAYLITKHLLSEELFGLTSQIKRSAISLPANIAEGCGGDSNKEFLRFLDIANGSAFELETLFILATDLEFINETSIENLMTKLQPIERMINNLKLKYKNM